ncbi:MAG: Crp/Fnr family transcriptional regulator [Bacteroidales bacterium]
MKLDKDSLNKYQLTEEELKLTLSSYVPQTLKANEFFLKEGEVCNYIGFVTKGILRAYIFDDFANEITTEFYPEGSLIISFDSFNNQIPSKENIRAIEDSELMVISFEKQKELYRLVPAWNQICKDLADFISREMIERTRLFQTMTATERYNDFCKKHPDILQRVTLGCIASYIGVDIATLSRIRKKV